MDINAFRKSIYSAHIDELRHLAMKAALEAETLQDQNESLAKIVSRELCRVANAYAADGDMSAATAIHDASLCVDRVLRRGA